MSTGYVVGAASGVALIYLAVAEPLTNVFSRDSEVLRHGASYLRIIAVSQIGEGVEFVLAGAGLTLWLPCVCGRVDG